MRFFKHQQFIVTLDEKFEPITQKFKDKDKGELISYLIKVIPS
ncbi:hypothetical protein HPPC_06735 [Helicobacter pylori PeCan4]|nr:hypothetical protein HPPC_06735 [Helicobacter pylori PeCan4]